jgi:hypothetical protein
MIGLVLVFGLLLCVVIVALSGVDSERVGKLDRIARELAGARDGNSALGMLNGTPVSYLFASRGTSSNSEAWTEIDVAIPRSYPLAIHIRRHVRGDLDKIASGDMIDVQVGDPVFDPLFLVEAAPADVVRILLDPELRGYLASHGQVELDTLTDDSGASILRLAMRGWYEELPDAMAAITAVVRAASRIREAFAHAEQAVQAVDSGSPYRPAIDDTPARDAAAGRARELEHLRDVRTRRQHSIGPALLVIVVVMAIFMLMATAGR